jgi:hypothetical protein
MRAQIRIRCFILFASILLIHNAISGAQDIPKPENATVAMLRAFKTHNIVMLGETHDNKQLYEWLSTLVATPEFADQVDDIVMEMGNSLYQKSVDRYVSGEDVPLEQVQKAWRNTMVSGPQSPVYAWFYRAVREANMKRRGKHQMRILCGDPYIDWEKVKVSQDINPFLSHRDDWYAQVVRDEVIARRHRALLIMGSGHFLRNFKIGPMEPVVEPELRLAGANTYLIIFGTNTPGGDKLDHRFDAWSTPAIVPATGWVGELPARPLTSGGYDDMVINMTSESGEKIKSPPFTDLKLKDAADALLYLGPRDSLTAVEMPRAQVEGTPYGKEILRRLTIMWGKASSDVFSEKEEAPQFSPPEPEPAPPPAASPATVPTPAPAAVAPSPAPGPPRPKAEPVPLPPRPPSQ